MRIYLDACCLNRLTDDQSQLRVREEAEAVEHILRMVRQGLATWVSSTILDLEIGRNPDPERRHDVNSILVFASEVVRPQTEDADRALELQKLGVAHLMRGTWLVRSAAQSRCFSRLKADQSRAPSQKRAVGFRFDAFAKAGTPREELKDSSRKLHRRPWHTEEHGDQSTYSFFRPV